MAHSSVPLCVSFSFAVLSFQFPLPLHSPINLCKKLNPLFLCFISFFSPMGL